MLDLLNVLLNRLTVYEHTEKMRMFPKIPPSNSLNYITEFNAEIS